MGVRPRRRLSAPLKREVAAARVRAMIADGTLRPGGAAPSGSALARELGFASLTCRSALEALVREGTLTRGVSPGARLRVARPGENGAGDTLRAALSKMLRDRRRAAGLTQTELAAKLEVSLTTVGHAETGRVWQSREFWRRADAALGDFGDLVRAFDDVQAATDPDPPRAAGSRPGEETAPAPPIAARPVPAVPVTALPASVSITCSGVVVVWPDGTQTIAVPPAGIP